MAVTLLVIYYGHGHSLPVTVDSPWHWFWGVFFFEYSSSMLGLLLVVPIVYATIALGWRKALIVLALVVSCILPYILHFAQRPSVVLFSLVFIVVPAVLVASVKIKLVSRAERRLAAIEQQRDGARILGQLIGAQEAERKRISQELHDGVAQNLLVIGTIAHNLLELEETWDASIRADLEAITERSLDLVSEVRAICQALRPSVLDNLGLVPAMKWLADSFQEDMRLRVELKVRGQLPDLGQTVNLALFRVVQEALANVRKHAHASWVCVTLLSDMTGVSVGVVDDGVGFDVGEDVKRFALSGKLGLLGMADRARAIGGVLQVVSTIGTGTRVTLTIDENNLRRQSELQKQMVNNGCEARRFLLDGKAQSANDCGMTVLSP